MIVQYSMVSTVLMVLSTHVSVSTTCPPQSSLDIEVVCVFLTSVLLQTVVCEDALELDDLTLPPPPCASGIGRLVQVWYS